ncbi:MAG: hypothetical protein KF905_01190 [Flavobacteriales bacterium]|nr:hypothetical protein [Flavobacteriales bacterium]
MKHLLTVGVIIASLLALLPIDSTAQRPTDAQGAYVVRVAGLTSASRDAIARELQHNNEVRLSYACVPAGILVFEPVRSGDREQTKLRTASALALVIRQQDLEETSMDRTRAEELCSQARNR